MTLRKRFALLMAAFAFPPALVLATAVPASAAAPYRLTDPTVRMYQSCPQSYSKGIVNRKNYYLKSDNVRCTYWVYEGSYYLGYTHTFSKVA